MLVKNVCLAPPKNHILLLHLILVEMERELIKVCFIIYLFINKGGTQSKSGDLRTLGCRMLSGYRTWWKTRHQDSAWTS